MGAFARGAPLLRRSLISQKYIRVAQKRLSSFNANNSFLKISEEVLETVHNKKPVVSLETTIYTHGYPHPENQRLSSRLERLVRDGGAVPATIGILNGEAHVGMSESQIAELLEKSDVRKISRRDLAFATGSGSSVNGGTTISGTMVLSHLAGIKVFATGGLGGVHKGGQDSLDISADLPELGRTPVAVISSGCKGFLDIPRTLEYLETQGAGVATFADGRSGNVDFPAFWSRDSGVQSPMTIRDEAHAAQIIHAQSLLGVTSGLHLANPVPEEHSIPRSELEAIIEKAVDMATNAGVLGHANTPYILKAIQNLTQGRSMAANNALIEANVKRGTKVAVRLSELECDSSTAPTFQPGPVRYAIDTPQHPSTQPTQIPSDLAPPPTITSDFNVIVAGSIAVDTACDYQPLSNAQSRRSPQDRTSNPADISQTVGGTAFNIARAASLTGAKAKLCTMVANDAAGRFALDSLAACDMTREGVSVRHEPNFKTAQYVAFNDADRNLKVAMADMRIIERNVESFANLWEPHLEPLKRFGAKGPRKWLIADGNWLPSALHAWFKTARKLGIATAFEPVSYEKSKRFFAVTLEDTNDVPRLADLAAPNLMELESMHEAAQSAGLMQGQGWWETIDALGIPASGAKSELEAVTNLELVNQGVPQRAIQLLPFVPTIMTKLGPAGVLVTRILSSDDDLLQKRSPYIVSRSKTGAGGVGGLYMRLIPPEDVLSGDQIVSVNGAGDTFLGALVSRLTEREELDWEGAVGFAQRASKMTLASGESVNPLIRSLR